jgi:hypothetical protein
MATYRNTRVIPIILVSLIIIIAVAAIISLARIVFFSGSSTSNPAQVDVSRENLLNTSTGHSVAMTVRGPIVADEEFHSYKVVITPNDRDVTTYAGYLDRQVGNISLSNNVASYEEFVYALNQANLAKGTQLTGDKNDVRGICATGKVYEFSILNNGQSIKTLWTTSCKNLKGSLDATLATLTKLFLNQIPDADKLVKQVKL